MMKQRSILVLAIVFCIAITGSVFADLTDGLVGYWPFNGNANDMSGGGNHGTVEGASLIADRFGNPNKAYAFDGDDRIVIGDVELVAGNTMTIAAWFRTDSLAGLEMEWDRPIVSKLFRQRAYFLGGSLRYGERIAFDVTATSDATYSDNELNDNLWHFAVGAYDGNISSDHLKLYIDGQLQTKTYMAGGDIANVPEYLGIGANIDELGDSFYPWDFFVGSIDDVRIYNRALTASEVYDLYVGVPVANAGEDQMLLATINGVAEVMLDGSGSSDPDGDDLFYYWYLNGELVATGVNPTIELPVGVHTIELVVNDGEYDSEPDYVTIEVLDITIGLAQQISKVRTDKLDLIDQIHAALVKEQEVFDTLEDLISSSVYTGLAHNDMVKAKQRILSAIQQQELAKDALQRAIDKLTDALDSLGSPVEP